MNIYPTHDLNLRDYEIPTPPAQPNFRLCESCREKVISTNKTLCFSCLQKFTLSTPTPSAKETTVHDAK